VLSSALICGLDIVTLMKIVIWPSTVETKFSAVLIHITI